MSKIASLLAIAAACVLPAPAQADPLIFVPEGSGYAWWTSELRFLPLEKEDEGISVEQIDEWISEKRTMQIDSKLCFMKFATEESIVAPDRATHTEIRSILAAHPNSFEQKMEVRDGRTFTARIGVFELCGPSPIAFMALVISDEENEVKYFDALDWNFMRLWSDGQRLSVLGCFACGERRDIFYDDGNDRFYFEWTGH